MKNAIHMPRRVPFFGALMLCLCLTAPAFGQLTLDAFSPAHGETNVGLEATLTLTFSAALDTSGTFSISDDFFLGFEVVPDPGEPRNIALSADRRTVTIGLDLQAETQYWVFLSGATSATGEVLDRPYGFTFTTGSRLPTASVSGTARFDGGDPTGALVGLFSESFFNDLFDDDDDAGSIGGGGGEGDGDGDGDGGKNHDASDNHDDGAFAAITIVTDDAGAFTIDFVPPGRYIMLALKDTNQDGDPTLGEAGEGFGAHDDDGNRAPDVIEVQETALDGFDVELQPLTLSTARDNFDDAQALAGGAALTTAFAGELTAEGEAGAWAYFFYDETTRDTLGVVTFFNLLGVVTPSAFGDTTDTCAPILCDLTLPLPEDWIDSDEAIGIVEDLGGAAYRARYPEAEVNAFLSNTELSFAGAALARHGLPEAQRLHQSLLAKTASLPPEPRWLITYQMEGTFEILIALLDAQTGEVVQVVGQPASALDNVGGADEAALAWQSDAHLVSVLTIEPLDPDGQSTLWSYVYYSPAAGTARSVFVSSGTILEQADIDESRLPSLDPLPENWIDSSVAAAEAEAQSNDFRNQHPDAEVFAQLSRGFRSGDPDRPVWRFTYVSVQDFAFLELDVDAGTGQVIVSAEDAAEVPRAIVLHQNYPNPFNPETTLTYEVHRAGEVDLTIYNVLGQTVRALVDGAFQPPGTYRVTWNGLDDAGRPAASGLYFYEIRLGNTVATKVMTLLR